MRNDRGQQTSSKKQQPYPNVIFTNPTSFKIHQNDQAGLDSGIGQLQAGQIMEQPVSPASDSARDKHHAASRLAACDLITLLSGNISAGPPWIVAFAIQRAPCQLVIDLQSLKQEPYLRVCSFNSRQSAVASVHVSHVGPRVLVEPRPGQQEQTPSPVLTPTF